MGPRKDGRQRNNHRNQAYFRDFPPRKSSPPGWLLRWSSYVTCPCGRGMGTKGGWMWYEKGMEVAYNCNLKMITGEHGKKRKEASQKL